MIAGLDFFSRHQSSVKDNPTKLNCHKKAELHATIIRLYEEADVRKELK